MLNRILDNHERIVNITSIIQNISLTLAALAGGIWACYTFSATRTLEKAQLDIEAEQMKKTVVDIDLQSSYVEIDKYRMIKTFVILKNFGRAPVNIDLSKDTLFVTPLFLRDNNVNPMYGNASRPTTSVANFKNITISPGNTVKLSYLTHATRSGEYVVEFRAPITGDIAQQAGMLGADGDLSKKGLEYVPIWTSGTFVNVPRSKSNFLDEGSKIDKKTR